MTDEQKTQLKEIASAVFEIKEKISNNDFSREEVIAELEMVETSIDKVLE